MKPTITAAAIIGNDFFMKKLVLFSIKQIFHFRPQSLGTRSLIFY